MAHLNYYLDLCADTYIVHDDAVLLRLHEKYDMWLAPGGHVDPGEDLNEAALREVWEEVGINVELIGPKEWGKSDTDEYRDLVPPIFINRHKISDTHDHSSVIFVGRSTTRDINPQTEADKGIECRWVTQTELDTLKETDLRLRPEVYRYATTALRIVQGA
jgi:8-oxo-dGTP pyrophosphatase MutT (NUDIX family)